MASLNSPEQPAPPNPERTGRNFPWPLQILVAFAVTTLLAHPDKVAREMKKLFKDEPAQKAPAEPAKKE